MREIAIVVAVIVVIGGVFWWILSQPSTPVETPVESTPTAPMQHATTTSTTTDEMKG